MKVPVWKIMFGWLVLITLTFIIGIFWVDFDYNFPYELVGYLTPILIIVLVIIHYTINKSISSS